MLPHETPSETSRLTEQMLQAQRQPQRSLNLNNKETHRLDQKLMMLTQDVRDMFELKGHQTPFLAAQSLISTRVGAVFCSQSTCNETGPDPNLDPNEKFLLDQQLVLLIQEVGDEFDAKGHPTPIQEAQAIISMRSELLPRPECEQPHANAQQLAKRQRLTEPEPGS